MKMKIIGLIVPDLAEEGGVRTVAAFLLKSINSSSKYRAKVISVATSASDGLSLRLSSPSSWFRGVRSEERTWVSHSYLHVGAFLPEFEFQRYRPRPLLRELLEDCDLVQVVSGSPAVGCSVVGLGKPVVLQVATRAVVERRRQAAQQRGLKAIWRRQMTRITDRFDEAAVRMADAVMVENRWMEDYCRHVSRTSGTKIVYSPPGIDTSVFRPSAARRTTSDDSAYILSVGRLHDDRKNIGLLLEAYRLLRARHAVFPRLVLAGATPPPEHFWERVSSAGLLSHVQFIHKPQLPELIALYQGAICFGLPSDEEGFGMVVIESMACGVPVVSTRCGGPDGIIEDGRDGYLVPINDSVRLAEGIENICLDEELNVRMGAASREKIECQYSISVAGSRFIDIYDDFLQVSNNHIA